MKKGQIFLIASVFVIMILVLLKSSLNLVDILENKRFFESGLDRLEFENLRSEISKSVQINYNQSTDTLKSNVNDFLKFAKISFSGRATDLTAFTVEATYPNISVGATIPLEIVATNILGENLLQLNLSFNGDTKNYTNIVDSGHIIHNFTFSISSNVNKTLSIYYATADQNITKDIVIPLEIGKSKHIGYFDIRLISERSKQKDRFVEIVDLNTVTVLS